MTAIIPDKLARFIDYKIIFVCSNQAFNYKLLQRFDVESD